MAVSDELNQCLKNISGLCTAHALSICKELRKTGISKRNHSNVASIKKKKNHSKRKNSSLVKSLLFHMNFRYLLGGIKITLCCISTVASTSILPAAARHPCLGKKCGMLDHLESLNSERNYICLAIALTLHQA